MNPTTGATYLAECKAQNFEPDTITLPSGTKAHWLGKRKAQKLVIYYHGKSFQFKQMQSLNTYRGRLYHTMYPRADEVLVQLRR